ncbi:unnamed protein product, partial [Heligmosomoides polygyrus]|uniref:Gag protein n=1 Tax=Heligmosomoides polygyrus TaxID=6339 RepID=A0A183GP40_HELPZ
MNLFVAQTAQAIPGMENLSEEERMKIEAVMACAELDAAASAGPSTAVSPLSDKSSLDAFSKRGPASDARSKQDREPSFSSRADFTPSRSQSSMSIRSDVSLPPMDGLSDEERAHIEAV